MQPHIAFELYANDAPVYTLCATSLAGRIVDVVGRHIKQNLLEVDADTSIARIGGYIGRPAAAKRRNGEQYLFVNGRYFKSSYLTSAIMKAYEKLIPESSSPSYFLYLTIDPSRIDVNVHPQKTEVKFADEEAVWQIINAAVRETLAKTGAVPLMDFDRDGIVEIPALSKGAVYSEPRAMSNGDYNPFREEYIDPTAPDPNVDFTGFDVPYDDRGQTLSDTAGTGFAPRAGMGGGMSGRGASGAACPAGCAAPAADLLFRKPRRRGGLHHPFLGGRRVRGFRFGSSFEVESGAGFGTSALEFIPSGATAGQQRLAVEGVRNLPIPCRWAAGTSPRCWAGGSSWWTCSVPASAFFMRIT